ncbi:MAG: hypothetical protein QW341_03360, partial [Candidatus Bathyarchaeia archaeon]
PAYYRPALSLQLCLELHPHSNPLCFACFHRAFKAFGRAKSTVHRLKLLSKKSFYMLPHFT